MPGSELVLRDIGMNPRRIGLLHVLRAIPQLQGYIEPRVGWVEVAGALTLAAVTALAGALYPAWYAANLKPAEALRFE